jgi:WD40 repeat protein
MAWSHDGKTIAVGRATDERRGVMLYDVAAKQFNILAADQDDILTDIAFSPDDKTLAVGYQQQGVRLWDISSGTVWQTLEHEKKSGGTTGMAFSQDGAVLATDGPDLRPTQVRLWDVSKRPGAAPAVPSLPKAHPEIVTQDDRLAAEIEHAIRGNFDPRNVESLKVEILADGSIKLTGKVSDREVEKVAEREAMDYHDPEDIGEHQPNKVVNEIEVTGKLSEAPPTRTRRTD